jgi:GGDEF domain-containing protein
MLPNPPFGRHECKGEFCLERQPSVPILVIALAWSIAALIFAAQDARWLAIAAAGLSAASIGVEFARMCLSTQATDPALLARYIEQARAGRRLAIYERDTGLFAHWYMVLRGQEECARAQRYGRPLSLLIIEPRPSNGSREWTAKDEIARWVQNELRATDVAGYLGNSRYVILAPEADRGRSAQLVERLRNEVGDVDVGVGGLPEDGSEFQTLWDAATTRLRGLQADAA